MKKGRILFIELFIKIILHRYSIAQILPTSKGFEKALLASHKKSVLNKKVNKRLCHIIWLIFDGKILRNTSRFARLQTVELGQCNESIVLEHRSRENYALTHLAPERHYQCLS